ncbi:MAG: efflux RND transporter periplasmic adaptor subunit [bacterium]|nr:efflux RND transporter periplasmic adaptor subunit [bacterium]
MKKILILLVVGVLVAAMVYAYITWVNAMREKPHEIALAAVTNTTIVSMLEENGAIRPRNQVIVKSEVNGRVDNVYIEAGDVVTAGHVLVELDKTDLLNRRRELELDARESMLQLEGAQLDYQRNRELYQAKLVSPDVYDRMRIERDLKSNRVDKIRSQITTVDDNLRKTTINAPMRGTIYDRAIEVGEVVIGASSVSSGTEMMKIADLDLLEVRALVNEVDISSISTGMPVMISVESLQGHAFHGSIARIAPAASTDKQTQLPLGFEVTVLLDARSTQLKPGMTATVMFTRGVASNVVAVPLPAVFCDNYEVAPSEQQFYVFVKNVTNFTKCTVAIGVHDLKHVQITSGLTERVMIALERPLPAIPASDTEPASQREQH